MSRDKRHARSAVDNRTGRPAPKPLEELHPFAAAVHYASKLYTDAELAEWLNAPQPLLEDRTPIAILAAGEADQLQLVMMQIEAGNYT